jgi:hypothetical protein
MKLLAVCIISHERPKLLSLQMQSLLPLSAHSGSVSTYVFDNSLRCSCDLRDIATKHSAVLIASPAPPSARKVDASPFRPIFSPAGLMEQSNATLQRSGQN